MPTDLEDPEAERIAGPYITFIDHLHYLMEDHSSIPEFSHSQEIKKCHFCKESPI